MIQPHKQDESHCASGERQPPETSPSPEAPFLREMFRRLGEAGAAYCVLRNYENLPYDLGGSDIDMLVESTSFYDTHNILLTVARYFGGNCITKYSGYRSLIMVLTGRHQGAWWGVRFDTFTYVGTNGYDILPVSYVLERRFCHNGLYVANRADSAMISFLKDVIGSGEDKKGYLTNARNAFTTNEIRYQAILKKSFGEKACDLYIFPLFEGEGVDILKLKTKLRSFWKKQFLKSHMLEIVIRRFHEIKFRFLRIIHPPGYSVAVLGTDGSGKSTIIDGFRPLLERALHTQMHYEHLRPNLLPSLARLFGRPEAEGPVDDPHDAKPSGFAGSLIRLTYYTLDYVFGYWLKVHIILAKRPCVWVFDRYFYDYLIDPQRNRLSLPRWIVRLYSLIIPRPDLVLCLGAEPEIIHARKPELPLEELKRQIKALRQFCDKNERAVWIDTGYSIEESVNKALEAITSRMAARYE